MINVYIQEPDGTFDAVFADAYRIDRDLQVWSVRSKKYLKPDDKGRVWLSVGSTKKRFHAQQLWEDSLTVAQGPCIVKKFTNTDHEKVRLLDYMWYKPGNLPFLFDTERAYQPVVTEQLEDEQLTRRFNRYLDNAMHVQQRELPTYEQFYQWWQKYTDFAPTLPDALAVYRKLPEPLNSVLTPVLETEKTFLHVYSNGSILVKRSTGNMVVLRPRMNDWSDLKRYSSLLRDNRLVFGETEALLSGPFKPLLAWVFLGRPQEGHVLYNITGNDLDFHVSNYVWLEADKEYACKQFRNRLLKRFWMEQK